MTNAQISRRRKNRVAREKYRTKVNLDRIDWIVGKLDATSTEASQLRELVQGKAGLHTKATLNRVKQIQNKIKNNTFNIKQYVKHTDDYKEQKGFIKPNMTPMQILKTITQTGFYNENRELIMAYNADRNNPQLRKELENAYQRYISRSDTQGVKGNKLATLE